MSSDLTRNLARSQSWWRDPLERYTLRGVYGRDNCKGYEGHGTDMSDIGWICGVWDGYEGMGQI